jgi:hypothetical protein
MPRTGDNRFLRTLLPAADRVVGPLRPVSGGVLVGAPVMTISGTASVRCPACNREHEAKLVQSINARHNPELKARLLAGDLNLLDCECGKRTLLAATLLYHDPDRDFFCQACPGGDAAMDEGEAAFRAIGNTGTCRLVPTQNALVEKVKILDANLDDRVVEVLKVLLLASRGDDINTILLFERADRDAATMTWAHLDTHVVLTSPLAAYDKLALTLKPTDDLRIDRAWAVDAARAMMTSAN